MLYREDLLSIYDHSQNTHNINQNITVTYKIPNVELMNNCLHNKLINIYILSDDGTNTIFVTCDNGKISIHNKDNENIHFLWWYLVNTCSFDFLKKGTYKIMKTYISSITNEEKIKHISTIVVN